jgi:hypothetical protein
MRWLGWLPAAELESHIRNSDCLAVIPFGSADRRGVPSKLFEFLAYQRPILLAGSDSGGIASLLKEWGHVDVIARTPDAIEHALDQALIGRTHQLLDVSRCARPPLSEQELVTLYADLIRTLTRRSDSATPESFPLMNDSCAG